MSFWRDLVGSKPVVPSWNPLNLAGEQQTSIANNIASEPGARQLSNLTTDQLLSMLSKVDPGFSGDSAQIGKNISSMLKGELPADVSRQSESSDAAKALGGGYAGSGASHALVARDLGLNSLQLTREGLSSAESWLGATEKLLAPAMHTYTSMFITPEQQAGFDVNERNSQFAHDYLKNQIGAMPDPSAAAALTLGGTALISAMRGNNAASVANPIGQGGRGSNTVGENTAKDWSGPNLDPTTGAPFSGADPTSDPSIWGGDAGASAASGAANWADFAGEMTI